MTTKKFYAGIGSREAPEDILTFMKWIGSKLYEKGYILRSGGAKGADTAFAMGAAEAIRIAMDFGVPIYNLANVEDIQRLHKGVLC